MLVQNQLCSYESAISLKALGVAQDSSLFHFIPTYNASAPFKLERLTPIQRSALNLNGNQFVAAFTTGELLQMLPQVLIHEDKTYFIYITTDINLQWRVSYLWEFAYTIDTTVDEDGRMHMRGANLHGKAAIGNLPECLAQWLGYLLESSILSVSFLNQHIKM